MGPGAFPDGGGLGEREGAGRERLTLIMWPAVITTILLSRSLRGVSVLSLCPCTWDFHAPGMQNDGSSSNCSLVLGCVVSSQI